MVVVAVAVKVEVEVEAMAVVAAAVVAPTRLLQLTQTLPSKRRRAKLGRAPTSPAAAGLARLLAAAVTVAREMGLAFLESAKYRERRRR